MGKSVNSYDSELTRTGLFWIPFVWLFGIYVCRLYLTGVCQRLPQVNLMTGDFIKAGFAFVPIPLCLYCYLTGKKAAHKFVDLPILMPCFFIFSMIISAIPSEYPFRAISFSCSLLLLFLSAILIRFMCSTKEILLSLGRFALISTLISFVIAILFIPAHRSIGINEGSLSVNQLATTLMTSGILSACINNRLINFSVLGISLLGILLLDSRASLMGLVIGNMFLLLFRIIKISLPSWFIIILAVIIFFLLDSTRHLVFDLLNSVLSLDEGGRGLDSGFSGRIYAWEYAWLMFKKSPLYGFGMRTHYIYVPRGAHNGYLALLLEVGAVGFIAFMLWMFTALKNSFFPNFDRLSKIILSFSIAFMAHAFFENELMNAVTSQSAIFIFWLFTWNRSTYKVSKGCL